MTETELEHERDALKEAVHMLEENAKGYPAHYLDHPAYQDVIRFAKGRIAMCNYKLLQERRK